MTAAVDAQRKVAEQAEALASEVEVDTMRPRGEESGLTAEESKRLIRLRYTRAIEALGRI